MRLQFGRNRYREVSNEGKRNSYDFSVDPARTKVKILGRGGLCARPLTGPYCTATVTVLLVTPPMVTTTGAFPDVAPVGTATLSWKSPTKPGARPAKKI